MGTTMKQAHAIDAHKAMTVPVLLTLMAVYESWGLGAWVYLGLHGTYGIMWVVKSYTYPDPNWESRVPIWKGIGVWLVLAAYWVPGWLVISRHVEPPPWIVAIAVAAMSFGTMLHFGSDAQKYYVLKARRGLITDGFFARTRNPNYLGEMLIYGSFALIAMHWAPWLILAGFWSSIFVPNMLNKDRSMSRYAEWDAYAARTGLLLPKVFQPTETKPAADPRSGSEAVEESVE